MSRVGIAITVLLIGASLTIWLVNYQKTANLSPVSKATNPSPFPNPTIDTAEHPSPDGEVALIIQTKRTSTTEIEHQLFVKKVNDGTQQQVFRQVVPSSSTLEAPFNSWSPDKKYFYIEHHQSGDHYWVFKASGEKFEEEEFIDVNSYFAERTIPYNLNKVTGWAAPNLLLVTTTEIGSDEEGPSYWFDVTRQNFTRLSTRF